MNAKIAVLLCAIFSDYRAKAMFRETHFVLDAVFLYDVLTVLKINKIKLNQMRKLTALLVLSAIVCLQALAIPAHRGMVQMPQPDGTLVTINLVGDEFYHFNTTADGYTVLFNESGAYEYARRDGMNLVSTGVLAHDEGNRSADELALLSTLSKRLVDETAVAQSHVRRAKRNVDLSNFDFENFRGLVILIDFVDKTFNAEDPKAFYTDMFSTENFTGFIDPLSGNNVSCLGSVRDYFNDQSNGAFKPPFDVYGPYTSNRKASQCQRYSTSIFTTALKNANDEIDFSRYDNNNDGKVDMIYFLVAGYSSSYSGNNSGYLWPHASNLSYNYISYDGKWMDRYASSTELYGFESSPTTVKVEGIGTICHEFSHVLGLPDFYDTDYEGSGGESHNPGEWDLMAGGSDFNYGRTPVGYTFFERYALGWAQAKTITDEGSFTLNPVNTSREGYILRTPVNNEFFTIENRQKTSWDYYLPGHGMIVTRVDSTNASIWTANQVNCNPSHNYFELLRAGNTTSGDLGSDPFPGTSGNPMLTNESTPSLKTWGGRSNQFNIVGISEKEGIIYFNVVRDGTLQALVEDFEGMTPNTSTTDSNVEGDFTYWSFNKAGVRAPGEGKADGENSVMMKAPSQLISQDPVYYNFYLAQLTVFNTSANVAKYSLEYSIDGGANWVKALTPSGAATADVPAKTTGTCYWSLDLNNHQGALFQLRQVATKDKTTYVDNFTLYYEGEEGCPIIDIPGDVNGDGEVNVADINTLIDIILGGSADNDTMRRADVNKDNEINIADVNAVIAIILS